MIVATAIDETRRAAEDRSLVRQREWEVDSWRQTKKVLNLKEGDDVNDVNDANDANDANVNDVDDFNDVNDVNDRVLNPLGACLPWRAYAVMP